MIVKVTLENNMPQVLEKDSSGFLTLLNNKSNAELSRMYNAYLMVANSAGINALAQIFRQYIRNLSLHILDSTNNVEKSTEKDGIEVIKKIIQLHVHLKVFCFSFLSWKWVCCNILFVYFTA